MSDFNKILLCWDKDSVLTKFSEFIKILVVLRACFMLFMHEWICNIFSNYEFDVKITLSCY